MKYLLDTDVVVDHLRKKKFLEIKILERTAGISIITLGELLYGACKSNNPVNSLLKLEENLRLLCLATLKLNELIILEFAKLKVGLEKSGQRLADFDLLIAATALVSDLTLVTRNKSHFKRIKNLKLL